MRPVGIAIAVAAAVFIAAVVVGIVFLVDDESAAPERGEVSLERVAEGGRELVGRQVVVSGDVYRRVGDGFTLGRELEDPVLVVPRVGGEPVAEGGVVRVTGTVRTLSLEELTRRLGEEVRPELYRAFAGEEAIVATRVMVIQPDE